MVQGELFREAEQSRITTPAKPPLFGSYTLTLSGNKILAGALLLAASGILIYCFGVEQGKRGLEHEFESLLPAQTETLTDARAASRVSAAAREKPESQELVVIQNEPNLGAALEEDLDVSVNAEEISSAYPLLDTQRKDHFTLQLVTYQEELQARSEVERLTKKGYESFVIPSGRFFQVCVNYFPSKSDARPLLKEIRSEGRYQDAYIRPVVR